MKKILPIGDILIIGDGNDTEAILGLGSFEELAKLMGNAKIDMINDWCALLTIKRKLVKESENNFWIRINGLPLRLVRAHENKQEKTVTVSVEKIPLRVFVRF